MSNDDLTAILVRVIEANTEAMRQVAIAVQNDADASFKMAIEVKGLRKTVGLAQQLVGGKMGKVIDDSKATLAKLEQERREIRNDQARSENAERRGTDAGL
jgi:DNA-binding XRE family transcriptional regulator